MKKIPLTQGKYALVDDADYKWLSQYNWYTSHYGYAVASQGYKKVLMHRLIMGAAFKTEVDHINHNKLDNQRANLRVCSSSQNKQNSKLRADNSSGYKGVSWDKKSNKWAASIWLDKSKKHLGYFDHAETAAIEYNNKAKELFNDFARLNEV